MKVEGSGWATDNFLHDSKQAKGDVSLATDTMIFKTMAKTTLVVKARSIIIIMVFCVTVGPHGLPVASTTAMDLTVARQRSYRGNHDLPMVSTTVRPWSTPRPWNVAVAVQ